jgi:hypothetical protein
MRAILALLLGLGLASPAFGQQVSGGAAGLGAVNSNNVLFWANTQNSCTWSAASSDVGPCINSAIAAAAANGGGTVMIPAGTFNVATALTQTAAGVHIQGAGVGNPRDNAQSGSFQAITRLVWTGTAGATMFYEAPSANETLYSADVAGITFDCGSLANICAEFANVSNSIIDIGVAEPRTIGAYITTIGSVTDAPGTQQNNISINSRSTNTSYSPTGILIDGNSGLNVSYNRFVSLYAWYTNGDGIVFSNQDNNQVMSLRTYPQPSGTGSAVIIAAPGYTMPNGLSTSTTSFAGGNLQVYHVGTPVTVQGYTPGSTLTAGSGNTGTAAVAPVTLVTNGTTSQFGRFLNFASTTGVAAGMDFSCGNPTSGVLNHSTVYLTAATTVSPSFYNVGAVASGTSCVFTWGVTGTAVTGAYTITATAATTYNITAPAGGHSQTGIAVSGGVLAFTDVVIPITGSASVGDTFTLVVGTPQLSNFFFGVDGSNGFPAPYFETGSTGGTVNLEGSPIPAPNTNQSGMSILFDRDACNNLLPNAPGLLAVTIGDCAGAGAFGPYSFVGNGITNQATGFGAATVGGQTNSAAGIDSFVTGSTNTVSGTYSQAGGYAGGDRGRFGTNCWANGFFAAQADSQTCRSTLRGTGAGALTAYRLTADQAAAGSANCINIPNNSAYTLSVNITALDHTTVTKNESWGNWTGLMTRGANAASTAVTMATTPTPISNGTITGSTIAATADTTNGCLNLSFTTPTVNTDTWNIVARVETVEVQ